MASGYQDKLPVLLELLVGSLAELKVCPQRFAVVKEALAKEYANQLFGQPYR